MLQLDKVPRRFGTKVAVDNVTIEVPEGQMVGVIGASGAGKSTLLRMINRLIDTTEGEIAFAGTNVSTLKGQKLRNWQRDCAMIFQQFNLVQRLDVVSNVLHGMLNGRSTLATVFNVWPRQDIERAVEILERLGVAENAAKRAEALSGGQQQRVAIARALMQRPKVILADEPIASLDPRNAQIVMQALRDINRDDGITVITNLHTLDTARTYCERIIGMQAGKVVFDGGPDELTELAARDIYGADGLAEAFSEATTSTSLGLPQRPRKPASELEAMPA